MINITDNEVYTALAGWLLALGVVPPGTTIQRGQQNRVSMPSSACVIMTTLGIPDRIGTNERGVAPVTNSHNQVTGYTASVSADFIYRVQLDFYSPSAESQAVAAELLWRDNLGIVQMADGMKPLYSEDLRQLPLIGGEEQFLQRWTITLVLDYQPVWTQPTEACDSVTVIPQPVDVYLSPSWSADSDAVRADSNLNI